MNGDQPRHDFFGDERPSTGEEFLDGVLLRASDSYEERKVPYLARLYASTLFDDSVSASYAHLLLKQIERTTYNQLVLLALSADESLKGGFIHEGRVRRDHELYVSMGRAIGAELMELGLMGLVARARAGGLAPLVGLYDLEVWEDLREYRIRVTPEGADLHRLSGLDRIPRDELEQANDDLGHEVVG